MIFFSVIKPYNSTVIVNSVQVAFKNFFFSHFWWFLGFLKELIAKHNAFLPYQGLSMANFHS